MSQSAVWAANAGTSTRVATDGSPKEGCGGSKHITAGRHGSYQYKYWLRFATDWTGVGRIVKATLCVFTDDLGAILAPMEATATPTIWVNRATSTFTVGNNADGVWDTSDWTAATATSVGAVKATPTKELGGLTRIDVTWLADYWAPKTVLRSNGTSGTGPINYGLAITGDTTSLHDWGGWSEGATDASKRPFIEFIYEYGPTVPTTPTNLSPIGSVVSVGSFQGDFADLKPTDTLRYSEVEVYTSAATMTGQVVTGGSRVYQKKKSVSNTETINGRFDHVPDNLSLVRNTTYKWRGRVTDQEGQTSLWTTLQSFVFTNTNPNAPTITPASGSSYATMDGVKFAGGFTDPDAGDKLLSYQVQLSKYGSGDEHWDDAEFVLWDTGKEYLPYGATTWTTTYGGQSLDAGTYYWRARVWDRQEGVSNWTYATIVLTANFEQEPGASTTIQVRPQAPWRIVIKDMYLADGVTKTTGRAPGRVVAILENAKSIGASIVYNSPGELHFTLPVDHPQLAVIEPKQTHYSVQFYHGDGWREVFAGLMWDFDANEQGIVFYGIDYLALYDYVVDERYTPATPDLPAESGGSKYVTAGKNSISYIIGDQLARAKALPNSPVGFINVGTIDAMTETTAVYSTYQHTLQFCTSLLDSHRGGTGKRSRISVRRTTAGTYEVIVQENPGIVRDNLRLRYGELVQGYRVIAFGQDWATRFSGIGRDRDGSKVRYATKTAPGVDEAIWGRFNQVGILDGVSDANDLARRVQQMATSGGKLGKSIGLGLRTGILMPRDGYDVTDIFPVSIEHGSVKTSAFGSGYWAAMAITWEAGDQGQQTTTLTLQPREDSVAPSTNLLTLQKISPQREWQVGWRPPDPLKATSVYWLDQTTNKVYIRDVTTGVARLITGTP